ncbi:ribosomal-protein-alanine N-acetyltransferase, partial [Achromobacter xylosoxidans]|nr:ribosomal-protein-alanine N-acetyltransferase [Achromobacter xylosoxidans]MCH1998994.1 ribosomal-protein-alanine N-acetyltransferase [Achromobacter xylosoxidans]
KARGYLQIGLRRGYYPAEKGGREDALVMQKRLDRPQGATA